VLGRLAVPVLPKPLDLDQLLDVVAAASARLPKSPNGGLAANP
jgi:hypothetical protein